MKLDLHTDSPEAYIAEACPLDLAAAVADLKAWDDHAVRVADYLFNAWVLTYSLRPNDQEGLDDLEYALHHALERAPAAASLQPDLRARWSAYLDLVHNRARLFGGDAEMCDILGRKHVMEILGHLVAGESNQNEMDQSALREARGISHERMSQVLRQMEGRGLISRRRHGKENRVRLTDKGRDMAPPSAVSNAASQAFHNPFDLTHLDRRIAA